MKEKSNAINLMKKAETLEAVHTCSFIGLNNAIFASINIVKKGEKF